MLNTIAESRDHDPTAGVESVLQTLKSPALADHEPGDIEPYEEAEQNATR